MYDIKPDKQFTKDEILDSIGQVAIFERYLGIEVQTRKHFCSPLRKDKHPTCNFSWHKGILYYRDWAEKEPKTCFDLVMQLYNIDFYSSLNKIAKDFGLADNNTSYNKDYQFSKEERTTKGKSTIEVKIKNFTDVDNSYLDKYLISNIALCRFKVFSIYKVWCNGRLSYTYNNKDPALGYYFGDDQWKIYFYKRSNYRFLSNTNRINGYKQLPYTGEYCIITKSMKDVMCLYEFGLPSIALQSETQIPDRELIEELYDRYNKLYTLYDYDYTGVSTANKIWKTYGIPYLFFTEEAKDFSDYVELHGRKQTNKLINKVKRYYD